MQQSDKKVNMFWGQGKHGRRSNQKCPARHIGQDFPRTHAVTRRKLQSRNLVCLMERGQANSTSYALSREGRRTGQQQAIVRTL
jgi:hypothetical protein